MMHVRRLHWKDIAVVAGCVAVALFLSLLLWRQQSQDAQIGGLSKALDTQREQVRKLGATPVAPPASKVKEDPSSAPTSVPATAATGPSDEQVRAAVAVYFQQHPVINNTPPDPGVVQVFVDAYLRSHPAPAGSPGVAGSPGTAGATGAAGADGAKGDPGRGVDHFSCPDTNLVVTYDDGSSQDLGPGSCGQGPKGDQGEPVHSYSYTTPAGVLGGAQTYDCTWDGLSKTAPHYDCQPQ